MWTYQGTFVDLIGGVYVMPQSANQQRNKAYYYNANGSTSPALPNPAPSVAACQAWGAANGLNVVGLEYIGECYGCSNCNYAVNGATSSNCTAPFNSLACGYSLEIFTLSAVTSSPPPPPSHSPPPSPSPRASPPPSPSSPPSPPPSPLSPPTNPPPPFLTPPSPPPISPPPSPPPSIALAPVWTYQGTFVDLSGGVYVMPQSANQQRNNAYYYNANGSTSPALPNPAPSAAACQAWGAANGLNVVGLEYIGECYGCSNCNYAVNGAATSNCTAPLNSLACGYSLDIFTLEAPVAQPPPPLASALSPPPPSSPPALVPVQAASVFTTAGDETHSVAPTFFSTKTSFAAGNPGVTSWRGNTLVITAGVSGYFIQGAFHWFSLRLV